MRDPARPLLWDVILSHAVLCLFLGALVAGLWIDQPRSVSVQHGLAALANGGILAALTAAFHLGVRRVGFGRRLAVATCVAFACGASVVMVVGRPPVLFGLTVLTTIFAAIHVRAFLRHVVPLLKPRTYATWPDVAKLGHVWATLIAAFALMNTSASWVHKLVGTGDGPFGEGSDTLELLDHLYFTIVVMTTLGFGDIVPVNGGARVLVMVECVTSYVMFALSIGIVTKGIRTDSDGGEVHDR